MSRKREEPFPIVLQTLRERLREGRLLVEQRLAASEIAEELGLSATPVREALARLAGEGLLEERRGQGYFVRRLTGRDVADLYRLAQAQLLIALAAPAPEALAICLEEGGEAANPDDPTREVELLFDRWVAAGGGAALLESHRRTQARLGPVRRLEPRLIDDLAEEAARLRRLTGGPARERSAAVGAYYRRRARLSARLAAVLDSRPRYSGDIV